MGASPVLLLHGQPGRARDWQPVSDRLADRHRVARVLVPDRPGYGDAPGPARGFAANADAMLDVLDGAGVDRATVVGHSWGGGVAIALADRHPDRVRGLALLASVGTRSCINSLDRVLAVPGLGDAMAFIGFRLLRRVVLQPQLRGTITPGVWRPFAVEQRALLDETPALEAALPRLAVPTTVVVGMRDNVVPPRAGEELAARIGGARLVRVPDAGHFLQLDAPDVVADVIAELAAESGV